jgi:iron(II)-dependent oxidoreductase
MLCASDDLLGSLVHEFSLARRRTDALFELVPREFFYERPILERHRVAFYQGHLEAFDVNLLHQGDAGRAAHNRLDRLFAFGIDPVGTSLPTDTPEDWPAIGAIAGYVKETRRHLDRWLADAAEPVRDGVALTTLMHAAIEHRLMHAETLAYMLSRLPINKPPRAVPASRRELRDDDMVAVPAGIASLGAPIESREFVWDNEYQAHARDVPAFEIDRYMVTNGQFRRFVDAGGYAQRRWWKPEDWQWRDTQQIVQPANWRRVDGDWQLNSFSDLVPFQSDWPVYVSHAEASAYTRWAGKALPTEAQWHRAGYGTPSGAERIYPWGHAAPGTRHGNFDFHQWDPMPVDAHPAGNSAFGVGGLAGNGWEWTSTPFAAFPGFQPFSFYRRYSADFFDGRHFVLKGGSSHTASRLLRRSFRNWFQPHYPYAFAGFRCVVAA